MAFRNWRLGMHIQQDSIAIVALLHERSHWALRRWWRIPLPPGLVRQGMVADVSALGSRLAAWRRELPAQHQVSIAVSRGAHTAKASSVSPVRPAGAGTGDVGSQRHEPAAGNGLPPRYVLIMRLPRGMTAGRLRRRSGWISMFCKLAGRLRLLAAIVPDASALGAFFPWMTAADQGLAWRDEKRWLWATREAWGSDACADV